MSDAEKPKPENLSEALAGVEDAPTASASNVISIEHARAELLRKPKKNQTPPRGVGQRARVRPRDRDVPSPVTMPPGEHDAVIVTDTPAARAHVEMRTVHPGEAPNRTHDKKVRVKTSLDPRRQKTQVTDRKVAEAAIAAAEAKLADAAPPSARGRAGPAPGAAPQSVPPPSIGRPRPVSRESKAAPLFAAAIAICAALGAVLVYTLTRSKTEPVAPLATATVPQRTAAPPPQTAASPPPQAATSAPATSATAIEIEEPREIALDPLGPDSSPASGGASTGVKTVKTSSVPPKPSASAVAPPVTAKPTTTNPLPFGKEEN